MFWINILILCWIFYCIQFIIKKTLFKTFLIFFCHILITWLLYWCNGIWPNIFLIILQFGKPLFQINCNFAHIAHKDMSLRRVIYLSLFLFRKLQTNLDQGGMVVPKEGMILLQIHIPTHFHCLAMMKNMVEGICCFKI